MPVTKTNQIGSITQPLPTPMGLRLLTDAQLPSQPISQRLLATLDELEGRAVRFARAHAMTGLRYSLGLVFFWFGFLKILGASPANSLVAQTVFWWDAAWFIPALGLVECVIGLCFFYKPTVRLALLIFAFQMVGTFFPFVILPHLTNQGSLLLPTMEGQYIIKNVVLIAAALMIWSRSRD